MYGSAVDAPQCLKALTPLMALKMGGDQHSLKNKQYPINQKIKNQKHREIFIFFHFFEPFFNLYCNFAPKFNLKNYFL